MIVDYARYSVYLTYSA